MGYLDRIAKEHLRWLKWVKGLKVIQLRMVLRWVGLLHLKVMMMLKASPDLAIHR